MSSRKLGGPEPHPLRRRWSEGGHAIGKSAVEARQGFRGRRVFYVLIASLALPIIAYAIVAGFVPR